MMATVPHVTSGSGLRKFRADGFLLDRVYTLTRHSMFISYLRKCSELHYFQAETFSQLCAEASLRTVPMRAQLQETWTNLTST